MGYNSFAASSPRHALPGFRPHERREVLSQDLFQCLPDQFHHFLRRHFLRRRPFLLPLLHKLVEERGWGEVVSGLVSRPRQLPNTPLSGLAVFSVLPPRLCARLPEHAVAYFKRQNGNRRDFPALSAVAQAKAEARSRVACPAVGQAKADHPACSRHEGQADLSAVGPAKVECQHANAPPRQVPGRVVIVHRIAPRLPSQHCGQCRHHQGSAFAALAQLRVFALASNGTGV